MLNNFRCDIRACYDFSHFSFADSVTLLGVDMYCSRAINQASKFRNSGKLERVKRGEANAGTR